MSQALELEPKARRVIKAPAVRRAELIDCARRLFLEKGYERTTINDVIAATQLSKGAFYHHFRAKEELLEAIAERFAGQALAAAEAVQSDRNLGALQRLNLLLAVSREWKAENLPGLRAVFTVLLRPENAVLYHRITSAVLSVMEPTFAAIIEDGAREGVIDATDARLAAEAILWMSESRRLLVADAMGVAERGDVETATEMIVKRIRAEEAMVDRVLGLAPGSIRILGSEDYVRALIVAWVAPAEA
jgi:AcrR family transcriptional regulator